MSILNCSQEQFSDYYAGNWAADRIYYRKNLVLSFSNGSPVTRVRRWLF